MHPSFFCYLQVFGLFVFSLGVGFSIRITLPPVPVLDPCHLCELLKWKEEKLSARFPFRSWRTELSLAATCISRINVLTGFTMLKLQDYRADKLYQNQPGIVSMEKPVKIHSTHTSVRLLSSVERGAEMAFLKKQYQYLKAFTLTSLSIINIITIHLHENKPWPSLQGTCAGCAQSYWELNKSSHSITSVSFYFSHVVVSYLKFESWPEAQKVQKPKIWMETLQQTLLE